MKKNQADKVLEYMNQFGSITPLEAYMDIGTMRLASRILDLKKRGYNILSKTDTSCNRFGEYVHYARYSLVSA